MSYKLETPFGDLWLNPTSGTHIYADANHNCLSQSIPVRPEGDRCAPLVVNRVEYGTTIHFYLWTDGSWHIGQEFNNGKLVTDYDRGQSLYMRKVHSKDYNDSHPSFSARDKVLKGVVGPLNEWCKANPDVLLDARIQDLRRNLETAEHEYAERVREAERYRAERDEAEAELSVWLGKVRNG